MELKLNFRCRLAPLRMAVPPFVLFALRAQSLK